MRKKGKPVSIIYPVIMSGGAGSRLWPLSRRARPKQFLALVEEATMLQATAKRLKSASAGMTIAAPIVICGEGQEAMSQAQLDEIGMSPSAIIVEQEGRNTAAVAAVAAHHVQALDAAGYVLLLAADHHVSDPDGFWSGVENGMLAAQAGNLVTLGIEATYPDTGYGYIRRGAALHEQVFKVDAFVEKPDVDKAKAYLEQGDYYWNAGIFLFRADAMLREFKSLAPDIEDACRRALQAGKRDGAILRLDPEIFATCRSGSVDVEIMERTSHSAVVAPVRAGWSDIGSWKSLSEITQSLSGEPNTLRGDVIETDCTDCYVHSDGPTVAAIGLTDIVVIATGDTVLVVHKDQAQDVKKVVDTLKKDGRTDRL